MVDGKGISMHVPAGLNGVATRGRFITPATASDDCARTLTIHRSILCIHSPPFVDTVQAIPRFNVRHGYHKLRLIERCYLRPTTDSQVIAGTVSGHGPCDASWYAISPARSYLPRYARPKMTDTAGLNDLKRTWDESPENLHLMRRVQPGCAFNALTRIWKLSPLLVRRV